MIQVNGEAMDWREGLTVRDILKARNFKFPLLIVTLAGEHVNRKDYDATPVPDGTDVQVVHLTSGG